MGAVRKLEPTGDASREAFLGVTASARGFVWRDRLDAAAAKTAIAISQRHGLPELLGRVLASRGIGLDEVQTALDPTIKALMPDPSSVRDMDKGAVRLAEAIVRNEPIAVFGDYDVDGACSAALMQRFLAAHGVTARIYIPDRMTEGYGPSRDAIEALAKDARLIVTVDCGTTSAETLATAGPLGADVVVVDHHQADERLPKVAAVINPNRQDDLSGLGDLCAAGVTFMLLVATTRQLRRRNYYNAERTPPDLLDLLDLVALATVCDVVPLKGLNRAYVMKGLQAMRQRRNTGLRALADAAGLAVPPTPYHLGFVLGPRVNAGGRVGASDLGARLLATDDPALAAELANRLDDYNRERREIEAHTLREAIAEAEARPQSPALVFAAAEGWHPGVIGIVAARLKERYERPACVVAVSDGIGKGSGRSVPGLALGPAVIAARQAGLLINGGGHAMAAGFTVAADKLDALRDFLAERLGDGIEREAPVPELAIDGALSTGGAVAGLIDHLDALAPFGAANPEPRFVFAGVLVAHVEPVGSGHIRCTLADPVGSARLPGIAFRVADTPLGQFLAAARGRAIHVAGHLRRDTYRGGDAVQLVIDDAAAVET